MCVLRSRTAEIGGWGRVKLDAEYPYIDLPKTKNDRPRRVPLSLRAVAAFRSLLPETPEPRNGAEPILPVETSRGIIHAFRDVIIEEAFPDLRWHDLRHEGISRLFELTGLRDHEIMAIDTRIMLRKKPERYRVYLRSNRI